LITSRDEREELAEFNLLAGQRAKGTTAYASALTYLTAGAALLPEDTWQRRHELTLRWSCTWPNASSSPARWRKRSSG